MRGLVTDGHKAYVVPGRGDHDDAEPERSDTVFNLAAGLLLYLLTAAVADRFERIWPPTLQEDKGKLVFLHDQALVERKSASGRMTSSATC